MTDIADDLIPLLTTNSLSVLADCRKAPNACEDVPVKEPIQIDDLAPMGRQRDRSFEPGWLTCCATPKVTGRRLRRAR